MGTVSMGGSTLIGLTQTPQEEPHKWSPAKGCTYWTTVVYPKITERPLPDELY